MTLNKEQVLEFETACEPLVKWLNDNCHPHVAAVVETSGAELLEGLASVKIEQFIKG